VKKVLLISHGTMAQGLFQAGQMIYGDLKEVDYLCLEANMGIETFKQKLAERIDEIKDASQIIILADLKGGSPYTAAVTLLGEKGLLPKCEVISGLNLPMLLAVLFTENEMGPAEVAEVISSATEGIGRFEVQAENEEIL
jgi:mannose/fructose/sorbose-specific phosphotransferase system IIA component